MNKKELFEKHLKDNKQQLKDRLFEILNGTGFEKFTSKNLQEITNDLKEIEILLEFLNSEDFKILDE